MKKTIILIIIFVLFIFGGWLFYWQSHKTKSLGSITYGWQTWSGVLPYLVAYEKGYFQEEGLEVKMVQEDSYVREMENLVSGKLDFIGDFALIDVLEKNSKGEKLKVVLITDYSNGADGIVAKKEIKTIYELKGKKVAVEKGTLGEHLLYDALKKHSLGLSDLQIINLTASDSAKAFINGEVDAAVTYEPDFSKAVEGGNGWRIFTSAEAPGLITDVLALKSDFISQNPAKVSAIVRSYFRAMDFIASNPDTAFEIGSKYFKITPSEFKQQYQGIKQVGYSENQNMLSFGLGSNSLHGLVGESYDFLLEKGSVNKKTDSVEIIDPSFVRGVLK